MSLMKGHVAPRAPERDARPHKPQNQRHVFLVLMIAPEDICHQGGERQHGMGFRAKTHTMCCFWGERPPPSFPKEKARCLVRAVYFHYVYYVGCGCLRGFNYPHPGQSVLSHERGLRPESCRQAIRDLLHPGATGSHLPILVGTNRYVGSILRCYMCGSACISQA